MVIDFVALKQTVLGVAREYARRGPRFSQQRPVLDEVASKAGGSLWTSLELPVQQVILTCWHDLFREGVLSWGYDLDTPESPFFHIPERTSPAGQAEPVV